ncbi:MAG: helix-turn-helix domain-containing protein [Acidimicrobiales bacterium]
MKNDLEQRWHDLGEFIRDQRRLGHLSLRKLSEMAGISNPYLSQIERGLRKPSADILQQLARALHISAESLYIRAGILDDRDDDSDVASVIARDPYLTEAQKKTLVTVYESFRLENGNLAPSAQDAEDDRSDSGGQESEASPRR